ncbi:MAG TPA: creatininase family protein, partial [Spirochaetia bacterium]|nr:creatininase family protein [Spirochaetia bacterium]
YLQAIELSRRVAGALGAYLLPTLPIVTSWGHIRFRGTVTFGAMTVRKVIEDIVESLYAGGFRKMVLVNVHGGNWVLKPTLIELNQRHTGLKLVTTGDTLAYRGQAPVEQLHAGEGEAGFIRAFYPECFREEAVFDYSPLCPASAFDLVGIGGVSPKGVWGYPSRGTPETGRTHLEKQVEDAVRYINRTLSELEALPG